MEERDRWALRLVAGIPSLGEFTGGEDGLSSLLHERQDSTVSWRGRRVHLERFRANGAAPTVLFHHGFGAYSALYGPFLGRLALEGINVVAIDRPGHGLSEGRRGDCTVAELADVTRLVIEDIVGPTSRAVVVFGSSAGGMLTSCMIPYLDDVVDGYICHGVHNPAHARRFLGQLVARFAEAVPRVRYPYRLLPRHIRRGISTHAVVREWFRPGSDRLAALSPTLRSVFSMTVAYRPPRPPSAVSRRVLVLTGCDDRMVSAAQSTQSARRLGLSNLEVEMVEGGHMLLHEEPQQVLSAIARWLSRITA